MGRWGSPVSMPSVAGSAVQAVQAVQALPVEFRSQTPNHVTAAAASLWYFCLFFAQHEEFFLSVTRTDLSGATMNDFLDCVNKMYQKKLHIICKTTKRHKRAFCGHFRLELQIYQFAFLSQLETKVVSGTAGWHIHQKALNGLLASFFTTQWQG